MPWPFTRKPKLQPAPRPMIEGTKAMLGKIQDGLFELASGLGGAGDKASEIGYCGHLPLTIQEIEDAIGWDGVMETFICRPAEDAIASGVEFEKLDEDQEHKLEDYLDNLGFWERTEEAFTAMRRTGFAAIWVDTQAIDPALPLLPNSPELKNIARLVVFDGNCITADAANYSEHTDPTHWLISNPDSPDRIHESRLLIFPGFAPSRRKRWENGGKGFPEAQRIWEAWLAWLTVNHVSPNVALAFEEPTVKMEQLNQRMTADEGRKQIRTRVADFSATRSAYHVNVIDAKEDYQRLGPPLNGIDTIYSSAETFLAAKAGLPYSILFGKLHQAGLGGSGATSGEEQQWEKFIARQQRKYLRPAIMRFLRLIWPLMGFDIKDLKFCFEPIRQHSELEWADIQLKNAQRDKIYSVDSDIISREEMRLELLKHEVYNIDPLALPDIPPQTQINPPQVVLPQNMPPQAE